jgi:hypothetical protein
VPQWPRVGQVGVPSPQSNAPDQRPADRRVRLIAMSGG